MADTYEAPAIESRTEITPALIGAVVISANIDNNVDGNV
jgi:hypothetical protein